MTEQAEGASGNANVEETVETLRTQMVAMQTAIEGQSASSFFRPKTYSGFSHEDVTDFIERFERYAKFYNWSNNKKLSAISLLFEGPALAWFYTVPEETRNNFANLLTALRQRFASPNEQFLQRQELNDRKQSKGESLSSYTEDIIRRCNRLELNDTNRMNSFISGLNDELKSHVILNRPKTFEEAESLARLKDAVNKSTRCAPDTKLQGSTTLIDQIHGLLNDPKIVGKEEKRPSHNDQHYERTQERQRISELEGQVQLLMTAINRPKESTIAPMSTTYRSGASATGIQDVESLKKEIIASVRDEMRKETQHDFRPQQPEPRPTYNTRYPRRESRGRNLRTTDGQPICNSCRKVGHVARYCKESGTPSYLQFPFQNQSNAPTFSAPPPPVSQPYYFPSTQFRHNHNTDHLNDQGPSTWGHRGAR